MTDTEVIPIPRLARGGRVWTVACGYGGWCEVGRAGTDLEGVMDALALHVEEAHTVAPYDRFAGMYDALVTGSRALHTAEVTGLLLSVLPRSMFDQSYLVEVVDLCCGNGVVSARMAGRHVPGGPWWNVTGVDQSIMQLALARHRLDAVRHADATDTGLPAGRADLVLCTYGWTDVQDWPGVIEEAWRLLAFGGTIGVVGAHPAFVGAHVIRDDAVEMVSWHGDYLASYHASSGPGFTPGGLRESVGGAWHRPLSALQEPFARGWSLSPVREAGGPRPTLIGWSATKVDR